jgi:rod shape determining protein RodA
MSAAEQRLYPAQKGRMTLVEKLRGMHWTIIVLLAAVASIGFAMLYSVSDGSFEPYASRQIIRFCIGICILLTIGVIDIRFWLRSAYPIYFVALVLITAVDMVGIVGGGSQRWLNLGVFQLQPSEIMKVGIVLALARYYHGRTLEETQSYRSLIMPFILIGVPAALILKQPDLGTAILICVTGAAIMFLAGVKMRIFGFGLGLVIAAVPAVWPFLRDYQKGRILTFLDPSRDPLGQGYHSMQSMIALGSAGVTGKGFMHGTQSHLNFLPEHHTDFIFTMLAEEFGMVGGLFLLTLYIAIIASGIMAAMQARNQFARLVGTGIIVAFSVYVFINVAMVMGLLPIVGVPLPLVSYGGTAMMTILIGFGFVMSAYVHRDVSLSKTGATI